MSSSFREWHLEPESEFRFELDPNATLAIKLVQGHAEIFGAELAQGQSYLFASECKAALFTWHGCTIQISSPSSLFKKLIPFHVTGRPSTEYVSDETPMATYANVHLALEQMRVRALRDLHGSPPDDDSVMSDPPRVLLLGPENSGKTSISKILTNYSLRVAQNWSPILINLDPSQGACSVPGTISATAVTSPIGTASPANPLGAAASSAPTALTSNALVPLTYWYGHPDPKSNPQLLHRLIQNLALNVLDRHDIDPQARVSGLIIDTPSSFASGPSSGSAADTRLSLIKTCVDAFQINVILVVGHEKLNAEMQRLYGTHLSVVKIPKSGGVVELDHTYRDRVLGYQIHAYMYGHKIDPPPGISSGLLAGEASSELVLSPSSSIINTADLAIYRIGPESMAPSSALPIGAARTLSEIQPTLLDPASSGSRLVNKILALLAPFNHDENERYDEEILDLPVVGFIVITSIDIQNKKMTILAPNQGSIVGRTAITGAFEWSE